MSEAFDRLYREYLTPRPEDNELFTSFKFTRLEGFDYNGGDGTISRRDPSKILKAGDLYYVWYTKRDTAAKPVGAKRAAEATDTIPSTDWDLCEIWYATSQDGFVWQEQGVAVPRPPKPQPGHRSVTTTDILHFKSKYYLYYQAFSEPSGLKGDHCPVSVSWSDSPDGPWTAVPGVVVPNGEPGTWDQYSIHDPYPIVYKGRIYLYYKAAFGDRPEYLLAHGLAISDDPLGPFEKHPLNPVMNSGHEVTVFPFKEGVAALAIRNGNEANTIQYAPDGVNFKMAATTTLMPTAAGPYVSDAFDSNGNGRGITWGLSHYTNAGSPGKRHSILGRFDCDLSLDVDDQAFKRTQLWASPEMYFAQGLSKSERKRLQQPLETDEKCSQ